jgi:hypothetical protein
MTWFRGWLYWLAKILGDANAVNIAKLPDLLQRGRP